MNFDTYIIVCKRAIKHGGSYDDLLSREVYTRGSTYLRRMIRKFSENTRELETHC